MSTRSRKLVTMRDSDSAASNHKRQRSDDDEGGKADLEQCSNCRDVTIGYPYPCFELHCEDKCTVCALCFSETVSDRHCKLDMDCPCCDGKFSQWKVSCERIKRTSRQGLQKERAEFESAVILPDEKLDPVRYHESMASTTTTDGANQLIGISFTSCRQHKVDVASAMFPRRGSCNEFGEEQLHLLETLAKCFHSLLIANDEKMTNRKYHPTGAPLQIESLFTMASNDHSPLHRVIHALGYGEDLQETLRRATVDYQPNWKRLMTTSFAATDTLRYLRSTEPGRLKESIGVLLKAHAVGVSVYRFLNEIAASKSYSSECRLQHRQFADKMEAGLKDLLLRPHDFIMLLFDNIGFKMGGRKVGYLQMTLMYWVVIRLEDMIKWGIYPDPKKPGVAVKSRVKKDWAVEREKENVGYEQVMAPTAVDFNRLGNCQLGEIDALLQMYIEDELFTHKEAEIMREADTSFWTHSLPDLYGQPIVEDESGYFEQVEHSGLGSDDEDEDDDDEDGDGDEEDAVKNQTHLEANDAFADCPIQQDLNKDSTCRFIANYAASVQEQMLEMPMDDTPEGPYPVDKSVAPIGRDVGVGLACDGAPACLLRRAQIKVPSDIKGTILNGGFHVMLNSYKAIGKLFRESALASFFGCWRTTPGQLKWVLEDPGDPNQISAELRAMMIGLHADAIAGLIATRRDSGLSSTTISPTEVLDHMLQRAKDYPMVALVVNSIPLSNMICLLHDAEVKADTETFISAMRLLHSVFCVSHQNGYALLIAEFLTMWHCASDAEKTLYKHALLFRTTKNGSNMYADCWVEQNVGYARMFTGKKAVGRDHATTVKESVLLINDRLAAKEIIKREGNTTPKEPKFVALDKVTQEACLYSRDCNLFGPGPPRHVPAKPWAKRKGDDKNWPEASHGIDGWKNPTGKVEINPEIASYLSIGSKRSRDYFDLFYMKGDLTNSARSEQDGVSLKLIESNATTKGVSDLAKRERWVSLDAKFLATKKLIIVRELRVELQKLNEQLVEIGKPPLTPTGTKKDPLIDVVIAARKTLIAADATWKAKRLAELDAAALTDGPEGLTEADRQNLYKKELELPFYTFANTAVRTELQATLYQVKPIGEAPQVPPSPAGTNENEDHIESQNTAMSSPSTGPVRLGHSHRSTTRAL